MKLKTIASLFCALALSTSVNAQSLSLDFQPTGGTTAAGFTAYELDNGAIPDAAGLDFAAFGTTVNVAIGTANLPDGAPDFRAVARNGAADESVNDWLGVDTRNDGVDVTMDIIVSGLPAGEYTWLSEHHDGGDGATNGNLNGGADATFTSAGSVVMANAVFSAQNDGDPISTFSTNFMSDGTNPVSLSLVMDFGQGIDANDIDTGNHLFAFTNSLAISVVPEPNAFGMIAIAFTGLAIIRRRR